ncbi:FecR family protein [Sphingobacterium luzhongxinii]|uniref:FecR family protein n=1 Tax=Sphingobacterium luzhongxinii TaxID=2654181 RepID=UPI0013DC3538|nr:FecR family protein [Sphingobacterium sp. xlx-73]
MNENVFKAKAILQKYKEGICTPEEKAWVEDWYLQMNTEGDKLTEENLKTDLFDLHSRIGTIPHEKQKITHHKQFTVVAAACLIIALSFALYFYSKKEKLSFSDNKNKDLISLDVKPGGNRAILTLADGSAINLSDEQIGIIIGADSISYADGSSLSTIQRDNAGSLSTRNTNTPVQTLALTTPKGGQYQVTLPDGSKVRLNAATTLKYPARFTGKDRRVELEGEAYFEVASGRKRRDAKQGAQDTPFIVQSVGQEVRVLGTHFNIKAYTDESNIKTTLVEGAVQVSSISQISSRKTSDLYAPNSPILLVPGQESINKDGNIIVQPADFKTSLAWVNDQIYFKDAPIEDILKEVSRWYDIEVAYKTKPTKELYSGGISRKATLSSLLKVLEKTGLQFTLIRTTQGNKLVVQQ